MENTVSPTPKEQIEFSLILRNGIELQLGKQDPLIKIAARVFQQYPHHLILIQSGSFLHAYNKSAYFLHKTKNYQLKIVGTEVNPDIRCGLPLSGHKRRLWNICHDFSVPYVVALGFKGNYQLHISNETIESSLMDEIPKDIVEKLINDLSQTDRLRTARTVQMLLKPEQITFRLKQVGNELYLIIHKDLERFPKNHRYFIGRDISDCIGRIIQNIYRYTTSGNRLIILQHLSSDIDLLKMIIHSIYQLQLIDTKKYSMRSTVIIELGNLIGGLISKLNNQKLSS